MRGHLQRRSERVWRLFVDVGPDPITGRRRQRTRTFHGSERQAHSALARFVVEAEAGMLGDVATITVEQLIDRWLGHVASNLEPNTLRGYRSKITTHIVPNIGARPIAQLRGQELDALYDRLTASGQAANSVRRVHAIVHRAFEQAILWEWVTKNPADRATPPTVEVKEPDDLDPALVAKAIMTSGDGLREIAWLAATTGAREAELCGLRWGDFDRVGRTLQFRRRCVATAGGLVIRPATKNRSVRAVGLDRHTVAMLRLLHYQARLRARTCGIELAADAHVFSEVPDGAPLSPAVVSQRWYRHRTRLGLTLRFHDLRHFHVTLLLDAGMEIGRVSRRAGHARTSTTTDVYAHALRTFDHDLADTVARRLR